jgi:hypothetical protein
VTMQLPLVFLIALFGAGAHSSGDASSYTQSYRIYMKGQPVGTESVSESADARGNLVSSSQHELVVSDGIDPKRMAFTTRLVLTKGTMAPSEYSCTYTTGDTKDSYDVSVRNGHVERVLRRGGRSSAVTIERPADLVIVDFSVYHHYDYLIRKYESKKGGRQSFHNFIPVIGSEVEVALTRLEDASLETPAGAVPVRNFRVEFVGVFTGTVSTDRGGRLVRLLIPQQDLEVLREDVVGQK